MSNCSDARPPPGPRFIRAEGGYTANTKAGTQPVLPAVASEIKARRPARFRQAELERTVKALRKTGLEIAAVKVEPDGTLIVIPGVPSSVPTSPANPWDGGDA